MRRVGVAVLSLGLVAAVVAVVGIERRWFHAPYPALGKRIAWWIEAPEPAYQFDVVVPGRLYRSAAPDPRFTDYVREHYGVERIVSLTGAVAGHARAERLGIPVVVNDWSPRSLPPREQIEAVLALMEDDVPTLVHCASGSDRTGYALAIYRVRHDGWSLERAVDEMRNYSHRPEKAPRLHAQLAALLEAGPDGAGAKRPRD